jgi:hypothetical protein
VLYHAVSLTQGPAVAAPSFDNHTWFDCFLIP